mmetsp:Transcript_15553/g.21484  ORF Transcript_15553/g.21484 Transcript_15553/m.21484 type:complete len:324 (-) Transcript_15553:191-1162(-)|eukprot:CAMPEP_0196584976 /NCGR_PEP_ID=MMETSP1081-20130531/49181_1 /TAXON_ID=36882 /ORGANISM="Pyramimonas amylifera, Strain CCMP720" /LENGTH=323 /DNA_ID=CAMNT_0041906371 /DNA_START=119 /DNA_END=1090 /DNA_ORIENTATION=+
MAAVMAPSAPVESTPSVAFDSGHADMVHDAQPDYYGKRLATCSSDSIIKLFDVRGDSQQHIADLFGHTGPVWQVCWAHPKFGTLLASCSFDRTVIIWKETAANVWEKVYVSPPTLHESSINSISFAPHELGLHLACASSDGSLSVLSHSSSGNSGSGEWTINKQGLEKAHPIGCTAVSWAPGAAPGALVSSQASGSPQRRLVSSGCDNTVKIWAFIEASKQWRVEKVLEGHTDWVRDCAWAPNAGLPMSTVASCGQDGVVFVWTQDETGAEWKQHLLHDFKVPVWRLSWSATGNILAVSDANHQVSLWKEQLDESWIQIQTVQ